ncbi:phage holin family protein [Pseudoxanthomonas winnipegensis]|uniref:Phage holin family protein n=1 Tax=Pseudoxanthomonas winnipegensis TaxID=2480810 RepID=A0A4Q8LDD4_9GAMM|nr:phage holin family protein [Pseudoxanthomonas winnipegensis]TAA26575.1 phage holin family protein [Pseudoxanthomonas winnipegensis]
MRDLITVLTLALNAGICLRLLTYRSGPETRHRRSVGVLAWVLIASTGCNALQILTVGYAAQGNVWQLGVLAVLLVLAFRANGNVARLLRMER